ncbi:MAG: hypothetical protein RIT81_37860 [Deltaproteobacteria bacterium]
MAEAGPTDTNIETTTPPATDVPATGVWRTTSPAGVVGWVSPAKLPPSPAVKSVFAAALVVRPTTLGTTTEGAPEETMRSTAVRSGTTVPPVGVDAMMWPAGIAVLA